MGNKALVFDINAKLTKEGGMNDSERGKAYSLTAKALHQAGLDDWTQQ